MTGLFSGSTLDGGFLVDGIVASTLTTGLVVVSAGSPAVMILYRTREIDG